MTEVLEYGYGNGHISLTGPPMGLPRDGVTHTLDTVLMTPLSPTAAERKRHLGDCGEDESAVLWGGGTHV